MVTSLLYLFSNLNSLYRLGTNIGIGISTILIGMSTLSALSFNVSTLLSSVSILSSIKISVILSIFIREKPIFSLDINILSSLLIDFILLLLASTSFQSSTSLSPGTIASTSNIQLTATILITLILSSNTRPTIISSSTPFNVLIIINITGMLNSSF